MDLIIETTDPAPHPGFNGPALDLLTFLTFGASERYGARHPLSGVANILRRKHTLDLSPIFHFGDAVPEDEADEQNLAALWQDAAPLATACRAAVTTIQSSDRLRELAEGAPELLPRLDELAAIADWAEEREAKVRITYRL